MFCIHCGTANQPERRTCASCGAILIAASGPRIEDSAIVRASLPVGRPAIAILAGYVGLFALFLPPFAPFSIALGILALRKIKRTPGTYGKGRAWFAIIAGALWLAVIVVILTIFLVSKALEKGGS